MTIIVIITKSIIIHSDTKVTKKQKLIIVFKEEWSSSSP